MPNEVYQRTRDGLARMLSPRAATRVLDDALRSAGVRADALRADQVRDLLLGPVRHELEAILPRAGLRRTLRRLARSVRDQARRETGDGGVPGAPEPPRWTADDEGGALHPVTASSVYLPGLAVTDPPSEPASDEAGPGTTRRPEEPRRSAPPPAAAPHVRDPVEVLEPPRAAAVRRSPPASTATVVPPARTASEVERLVRGFAQLDGVLQVVAVGGRGEVVTERGHGLDAAAAAPLVRTAAHLLGRHGRLRSMVLEHADGLLFVFPMGRETAVVRTRAHINLGAVLAARSALEEGL